MEGNFLQEAPHVPRYEPRYDLAGEDISALTQDFLSQPGLSTGRFVCANFSSSEAMANVGRSVERQVFEQTFGNDASEMVAEYGPYEAASHFLVVFDRESQQPAGVLRLIKNSPAGLKSLNDLESYLGVSAADFQSRHNVETLDTCWDVGTLAVEPHYRGKMSSYMVSTLLYRAVFLLGRRENAQQMVTIIDRKARKCIELLGIPFSPIEGTGPFEYLGSPESTAMYSNFSALEEEVGRRYAAYAAVPENGNAKPGMRQMLANVIGKLATGINLDDQIHLSASV